MRQRVRWLAVVVAIFALANGAPARAGIEPSTSPPYAGTDGWQGCDSSPGSTCTGVADGDVSTGRLQNSWTVTSPGGGSEPGQANGRADRYMWTDLALDEPAGAVVLTYRIHVNEASATTDSAGGHAEAQLLLSASHQACAGSGCMTCSNEIFVSTDSGPAVRQSEDLVRTVRLTNRGGGNLPAGTVRAMTELYGGAFIGDYQTGAAGSSSLVTDVVWTSLEAIAEPPVSEPPPGTAHQVVVTRPFVGGQLSDLAQVCQDVLPVQPAVGGACFTVPPGAVSVRVSIGDLVN